MRLFLLRWWSQQEADDRHHGIRRLRLFLVHLISQEDAREQNCEEVNIELIPLRILEQLLQKLHEIDEDVAVLPWMLHMKPTRSSSPLPTTCPQRRK